MKRQYILTVMALSIATVVMAGNDPQASVHNYKHPGKAAQAQKQINAQDGQEITVVVKETEQAGNYKSNFKKSTITYVKAKANQESVPSNSKPQLHNYKNQFQF